MIKSSLRCCCGWELAGKVMGNTLAGDAFSEWLGQCRIAGAISRSSDRAHHARTPKCHLPVGKLKFRHRPGYGDGLPVDYGR